MHFKFAAAIAYAYIFLSAVSATAHYNVTVGSNNEDSYEPQYLTGVNSGDIIRFLFVSQIPHSVTQSTFNGPCSSRAGGLDSGVMKNTSWTMTVSNVSAPLWFSCTVGTHCSKSGMVFAINPTLNQTFGVFQAKAVGASSSGGGGASNATTGTSSTSTSASETASATPSESSGPDSTSGDVNISIQTSTLALAVALFFIGLSL